MLNQCWPNSKHTYIYIIRDEFPAHSFYFDPTYFSFCYYQRKKTSFKKRKWDRYTTRFKILYRKIEARLVKFIVKKVCRYMKRIEITGYISLSE